MGRPIKKKFFGNLNNPYNNYPRAGRTGVGAESITSSITVASSGTRYSAGATLVVSAPDIAGGTRATATPTISLPGIGGITAVALATAGTGYTATATITVTTATTVSVAATGTTSASVIYPTSTAGLYAGMRVTGTGINAGTTYVTAVYSTGTVLSATNASTVTGTMSFVDMGAGFTAITALTTTTTDALAFFSYLTTGTSKVNGGDILKQESSKRYLVQNSQGQGQCKLVTTSTLAAGQMCIVATDYNGSTYLVRKLTARKAVVVQSTASGSFLVGNNAAVGWTLGAATGTVVTIANTN